MRGATDLPVAAHASHARATLMLKRYERAPPLASRGRWLLKRRAPPWRHRLTGQLWPGAGKSKRYCCPAPHQMAHAPLHPVMTTVMGPRSCPPPPPCRVRRCSPVEPPTDGKSKEPRPPTGVFNPELCGGSAPHEFLFVGRQSPWHEGPSRPHSAKCGCSTMAPQPVSQWQMRP
jgi:hypothetical protein